MTRIHIGLLFLFPISLALLPASAPAPVMAQDGGIQKVILKPEDLPSLGSSEQFSPADVNDDGLVVFYGRGTSACGFFIQASPLSLPPLAPASRMTPLLSITAR